jgi:hypothetical protein
MWKKICAKDKKIKCCGVTDKETELRCPCQNQSIGKNVQIAFTFACNCDQ